jgi:hypothetical protein
MSLGFHHQARLKELRTEQAHAQSAVSVDEHLRHCHARRGADHALLVCADDALEDDVGLNKLHLGADHETSVPLLQDASTTLNWIVTARCRPA